jgi:hypothetical protein
MAKTDPSYARPRRVERVAGYAAVIDINDGALRPAAYRPRARSMRRSGMNQMTATVT